jgi:hypothetical protein
LRCTCRKLCPRQEYTLVFIWQERTWQTNEQVVMGEREIANTMLTLLEKPPIEEAVTG